MSNILKSPMDLIRNFTIIAHVDHGKSTLSDQILLHCNAIQQREYQPQMLDNMSLERERGITIKAQTATMFWPYEGENYMLNLIDTPGHVDFNYEVSRSMMACEISLLVVDATKGVEAQTIANFHKAKDAGHFIIPVINKIDMQNANIDQCMMDIDKLGIDISLTRCISAKNAIGIKDLIDDIVRMGRPPVCTSFNETRALVIDSWYDKYLGVVALVRVIDGKITKNIKLQLASTSRSFNVLDVGIFTPKQESREILNAGELGFVVTQLKDPREIYIGETILMTNNTLQALPGFKKPLPLVFCMFYPINSDEANKVHQALDKYQLNDTGFCFECENSDLYGLIFRCGFLGLLHLDIVKERIFREYGLDVMPTIPSVEYKVHLRDPKKVVLIKNANDWPDQSKIEFVEEIEVEAIIFTTSAYIGKVTNLCVSKRAVGIELEMEDDKVIMKFKIPLSEIIIEFYDMLQSITSGYASLTYEMCGYRKSDMGKLFILVNDELIEEFSMIVFSENAKAIGKKLVEKLENIIPREQVKIKIQAAFDNMKNIIARADINAYRKDVIAKCYGGDITRKKKLLEKQKSGKDKMNDIRKVKIPTNAVKDLLKL